MNSMVLNNDVKISMPGFGVSRVTDPEECERSVFDTINTGLYTMHQLYGDVYVGLVQSRTVQSHIVSNFNTDRLKDLIVQSEIVPAVNQIETPPFHQQPETQRG